MLQWAAHPTLSDWSIYQGQVSALMHSGTDGEYQLQEPAQNAPSTKMELHYP